MTDNTMPEDIQTTLNERGKRYGPFEYHAYLAQALKLIAQQAPAWADMKPHHREALDMILHKVARILNGDPNYDDSWRDIAGYAQLVVNIITKEGSN